jgi:5,10-methylene-tetrahydrofolate dehydrogenase/methenyl tetrahydrofolate cyclohydrolase
MALEDVFKGGNIVTGLAIGVGATILVPLVVPAVGGILRPAAKAMIKGGIVVYDWGRQAVAEVSEAAGDMAAEARAEAAAASKPETKGSSTGSPTAGQTA